MKERFLSMIYPIFTLINSIKKENMLFFVHFFQRKILSLHLYLKAVLEEKGKIQQMVI